MPTGLKQLLAAAVTDTTIAKVYDDALLTTGSLLLCDSAHSTRPAFGTAAAGVPATGTTCNNIADSLAQPVLGAASLAATWPTLTYGSTANDGSNGKLERTGKGALHAMVKQASAVPSTCWTLLVLPSALRTYVSANAAHTYYVSIWLQLTRYSTATSSGAYPLYASTSVYSSGNKGLFYFGTPPTGAVNFPFSGVVGLSKSVPAASANGSVFIAQASPATSDGWTDSTLSIDGNRNAWLVGYTGGNNNASLAQILPSTAFYRAYIEDLTVSGRTYATVQALDFARYTTDVLTAGGKFNGDTWSNPSTVVP